MRFSKITLAILLLSTQSYADAQLTPSELSQMLAITNQYRASEGLAPLCLNDRLLETAQQHSNDQARFREMSHNLGQYEGGTDFGQRSRDSGYKGGRKAENVAFRSRNSVQAVNEQWWKSAGHKKNILGDYTHIGIAMAKGDNGYYYTQFFGNSKSETCSIMGKEGKAAPTLMMEDKKEELIVPVGGKKVKGKKKMRKNKRKNKNKNCPKENQ